MSSLPAGMLVEIAVAALLVLTIGYCIVLNGRLKRLHQDRDALKDMVRDLVSATTLADQAIKDLKQTAIETDLTLSSRLEEAERFGVELANHVTAGTVLLERISQITSLARAKPEPAVPPQSRAQTALTQLTALGRMREEAA